MLVGEGRSPPVPAAQTLGNYVLSSTESQLATCQAWTGSIQGGLRASPLWAQPPPPGPSHCLPPRSSPCALKQSLEPDTGSCSDRRPEPCSCSADGLRDLHHVLLLAEGQPGL